MVSTRSSSQRATPTEWSHDNALSETSVSSQANARDGQRMHTYVIVEQPAKFEFYRRRAIELNPK